MILQIIFDDKFGDYAIEQFKAHSEQTRIVLITYVLRELKYVHSINPCDIIVFGSAEYKDMIAHFSDYKAVIMHGLFTYFQYDIIRHLPAKTKLAWVLWGAEIYTRPDIYSSFLAPYTRLAYKLKQCKEFQFHKKQDQDTVPIEILKRVDYILCSSNEIYEEVRSYIGEADIQHLTYSYFTLERLIGTELLDKTVEGCNILLGNSASLDNNHLDALMRLKRVGIPERAKLITPLSYGDLWIRNLVNKVGKILFKQQFYPLLEFMQRPEYNKLVQSCSVFVANHHRPNAFANTLTALYLGARVYVSEDSIQAKFLQNMGLNVDIIERSLNNKNSDIFVPHTDVERENDRKIIRNLYGEDNMRKNIQRIVETLNT